jgi:two-component system CheB/CheR fusion protein
LSAPFHSSPSWPAVPARRPRTGHVVATAEQILLDRYAPACLVVTGEGEIVHTSGPTHEYLPGWADSDTADVFTRAGDALQAKLRAAVEQALRDPFPVTVSAGTGRAEEPRRARITVEVLAGSPPNDRLFLIAFQNDDEPMALGGQSTARAPDPVAAEEPRVRALESELSTTRQELLRTIEQLELANEELKASNEEGLTANEELQAANEELQASKWQLQSLNETLEGKVDELERAGNDLDNLLVSTNVPTVFLDPEFRIRRFTPAAKSLFHLFPTDVGRPLADLVPRFTDLDLFSDAATVLEHLTPVSREIRTHEGEWYMREVLPYRTRENRIEGVVVTFSNVAGKVLRAARLHTDVIVDMVGEALVVIDGTLRVQSANRPFYEMFPTSRSEIGMRTLHELGDREFDVPALRNAIASVLERGEGFAHLELTISFAHLGERALVLSARPLVTGADKAPGLILLEIDDVTERKRREEAILASESKIRAIVDAAADGVVTTNEAGTITGFNRAAERMFGYTARDVVGRSAWTLAPTTCRDAQGTRVRRHQRRSIAKIIGTTRQLVGRRKDRTTFPLELSVGEYHDGARGFVGIVRDISERKKAEEATERHQAELGRALRLAAMGELAASLGHELRQPLSVVANLLEACITRLRARPERASMLIRLLEEATGEVVRTGEIVRNVRDLVQNRQPRRQCVDLRGVIETGAKLLAGELHAHRIALHLELGSHALPVGVVRVQMEQVLVNLLQNAIDAIRAGRRTPRAIVVRATTSRPGIVEVTVRDSGTGISHEVARRMFEPLYTTKRGGLGMGLALSRSIVEAHGGGLDVADGAGGRKGSTLRFTLPAAVPAHRSRKTRTAGRAR